MISFARAKMKRFTKQHYKNYTVLAEAASHYWKTVSKNAFETKTPLTNQYTLRSIRRLFATEYVERCTELDVLHYAEEYKPFNPLQHKTFKYTAATYARPGSNSRRDATLRCYDKFPQKTKAIYGPVAQFLARESK